MADPRLAVSFEGIGAVYASFKGDGSTVNYDATQAGGSAAVGLAMTLSADGTVATAADGEAVIGKLIKVEPDDIATVQVGGFMTLPGGDSASLTRGKAIVGAVAAVTAAEGYIREVATATAAELGLCNGMIVESDTATAVVVKL